MHGIDNKMLTQKRHENQVILNFHGVFIFAHLGIFGDVALQYVAEVKGNRIISGHWCVFRSNR